MDHVIILNERRLLRAPVATRITTTEHGLTCHSTRTRLMGGKSSSPRWGRSWRSPRSVACITGKPGRRPDSPRMHSEQAQG